MKSLRGGGAERLCIRESRLRQCKLAPPNDAKGRIRGVGMAVDRYRRTIRVVCIAFNIIFFSFLPKVLTVWTASRWDGRA